MTPSRFYTRSLFLHLRHILHHRERDCDLQYVRYTPLHIGTNSFTVLNDIENKASNVFDWFSNNYLKGDPDKSNLLVTFKEETENCIIQRSVSKKLLGVTTINSILLSVFKNYVKKRVKNSMLLHKF